MTMKMEWMRTGDNAPACWACFLVFDDHVGQDNVPLNPGR
jgi:hypothetical protein